MMKFIFIFTFITVGLAQESSEVASNKENENIKFLDLSNQGISDLKNYDFSKYPLLEELDLSNNEIEHIPTEIFSEHKNLKKLNLSGNTKLKLPEYVSLLNGNIEELNLSNCNIEKLPYSIFDGLLHLKTLDLSNNPLQDENVVQDTTLTNLVELQKITLPYVDKLLIQDICKYNNITVEIKTEDNTDSVHCTDINLDTTSKQNKKRQNPETPPENPEELTENTTENVPDAVTEAENSIGDDDALNIVVEPDQPKAEATTESNLNAETVAPEQTNDEDNINTNQNNEAAALPNETTTTTEQPALALGESTPIPENVPDAIDGGIHVAVNEEPKEENQESHPEATPILPPPSPPPMVRLLKPSEPNTNTDNQKAIASQNTSEKMQENKDSSDSAKTAPSTETSSTGTNVLIFLVVGVVIAGAAAFGYKFYKTRSYQATRTTEPIERELKEIVVEKKANGPNPGQKIVEEEPLMQKLENSVEIKEVDETNEAQSQDAQENIKENEVPKTTNTITSQDLQNSGPYRPTTTSFKPPTNATTDGNTPK